MNQASIKEYYINLQKLYTNVVNLLNGINKSLTTNISDIAVSLISDDNTETTVNIPSFLYLESRIEELSNNFESLVNLPDNGVAWLSSNGNKHKINVVHGNSAPPTPNATTTATGSFKRNEFLTNLLNPYTALRLSLSNVPDNVCDFIIKKFVIKDPAIYEMLYNVKDIYNTYSLVKNILYNVSTDTSVNIGDIYEEMDFEVKSPYSKDKYVSSFKLLELVTRENNKPNPYYQSDQDNKLVYDVIFDTIEYTDRDNTYVVHQLQVGDYITLVHDYGVYEIININKESYSDGSYIYRISIKEYLGHILLQPISINANMEFKIYVNNYKDNYIDIPLDSNQYVLLFVASKYNNYISDFSAPVYINLADVKMVNFDSRTSYLVNENEISYLDFFNKYCRNYGELINNISLLLSPSPESYTLSQLDELQTSEALVSSIDSTFNASILKVIRINDHIYKSINTDDLKSNLEQKNTLLTTISGLNNQIKETELSLRASNSANYATYEANLTELQNSRDASYQELFNVTSNINASYNNIKDALNKDKYRIRGIIANVSDFESFVQTNYKGNIYVTGIDVEYKYVSNNEDGDTVSTINESTFSNWNKMASIDRNRVVNILDTNVISVSYDTVSNLENVIKWNQIDIPITHNETVIIRLRYKYNIGNPFMQLYSPWSTPVSMVLPDEYVTDLALSYDVDQNKIDNITANVFNQLISEGYTEHINDSYIYQGKKYYHNGESILVQYSKNDSADESMNNLSNIITNLYSNISTLQDDIQELRERPLETNNYTYYHEEGSAGTNVNDLRLSALELKVDNLVDYLNDEIQVKLIATKVNDINDNIVPNIYTEITNVYNYYATKTNDINSDIVNILDDITTINDQLSEYDTRISDNDSSITTINSDITALGERVGTLEDDNKTMQTNISNHETELSNHKTKIDANKDAITEINDTKLQEKEDKIIVESITINTNTLQPEFGHYYVIKNTISSLIISLPCVESESKEFINSKFINSITIFFTTIKDPTTNNTDTNADTNTDTKLNVQFNCIAKEKDAPDILAYKNMFIEEYDTSYEINAIYNGTAWVLSYGIIEKYNSSNSSES